MVNTEEKIFDYENLLNKKSSRNKKFSKSKREFDIEKYKERIAVEFSNNQLNYNPLNQQDNSGENLNSEYEQKYKKYVQEEISHNTLLFINRIIIESKTLSSNLRTKYPIHKIFIGVVKTMLMNELELVYYSIYLDKMGWDSQVFSFEDNLLMTAFAVKMYLNDNFKFIFDYLNRTKNNLFNKFNDWLQSKKDFNQMSIPPKELNVRYNSLIKSSNSFCKNNFIDFNYVVDQILQMSLPYSENKNNQHHNQTENSISGITFKQDNTQNQISKSSISNILPLIKNIPHQPQFESISEQPFFKNDDSNKISLNISSFGNSKMPNDHSKNIDVFTKSLQKSEVFPENLLRNDSDILRMNSDNNFNFNREYSMLRFTQGYNDGEVSNQNFAIEAQFEMNEDEKIPSSFFQKNKSNMSINGIVSNFSEEKNPINQEYVKQKTKLGLNIPINTDTSFLFSKFKTRKAEGELNNSNDQSLFKEKSEFSQYFK